MTLIKLDNPRVWRTYLGGKLLDEIHGRNGEDTHFPEEWIMSVTEARNAGHENEGSNGLSKTESGITLRSLFESNPKEYLGKESTDTGVLVKLIDSAERLGIQVHPDKKAAKIFFDSEYGKTECWHILGTREINGTKPCVYLGFKEGVTKEKWRELFDKQDIKTMLNSLERFEVAPGDTILVEGGTPHAIGAGCFLCEIQEPTDYTIRVEKKTPSGFTIDDELCHQGIGFEKMFDVFHYNSVSRMEIHNKQFITPKTIFESENGHIIRRIGYDSTPCFLLEEIDASGEISVPASKGYFGLYVIDGNGKISSSNCEITVSKGNQIFVSYGTGDLKIKPKPGKELRIMRFFGPQREL